MNTLVGETGNAGAVAFGGPQKTAPANPSYTVGAVGFGPSWQDDEPSLRAMYEQACQTIVRLECEKEELVARVALLEEEQKILANGFPSPAKAAVTEGGTGYSGAERPEPSPQIKRALDRLATVASEAFGPFPVQTAEENLTAIEEGIHRLRMDNDRLERERDEWKCKFLQANKDYGFELQDPCGTIWDHAKKLQAEVESLRDQLCADKCREKAAADGNWSNI